MAPTHAALPRQVPCARSCPIVDLKAARSPPPSSRSLRRSIRSRRMLCGRLLGNAGIACLVSSLALEFLACQKRTVYFVRLVAGEAILVEILAAALLLASIVRPLASCTCTAPALEASQSPRARPSRIAPCCSSRAPLLDV